MAAHRRSTAKLTRSRVKASSYYVDGSAVRKPEPYQRQKTQRRQQQFRYQKRENVLGLRYTIFLAAAFCLMAASVLLYMHASTKLTSVKEEISTQQASLSQIQEKNDSLKESLNDNMDLNELYQKATQDLGMVYPDEGQVIYYDSSNSDYIRQYGQVGNDN